VEEAVMAQRAGSEIIQDWPEESREAAQLVLDRYGEPEEATESALTWYRVGVWKRIVASRTFYRHDFPSPHADSVESFLDYRVPVDRFSELAAFDGSVVAERTAGEVSARCHDEEANRLALNLMHDIVTGARDAQDARRYYAKEFLDYRRGLPTPYMDRLRFSPPSGDCGDPDQPVISPEELERAQREGEARAAEEVAAAASL
jgi:hypothetical protein